jgi:uncharacterized protein YyaL (SSP411 family)
MPNRLAKESSPYLLQHAHNPVDWFPWSDEAFEKAKKENKPILVSIGYAACHWCHVMERESFEDSAVAAYMNENFVNIKVDREERPDVDHIYMDAVQAMTGSGGWPLNAFLLSDGRPFYGGTYFPPRRAFNRASWQEVLTAVANAYRDKKEDLTKQAETLTEHLQTSNRIAGSRFNFNIDTIYQAYEQVMKTADTEWGGFGNAPKFPQTLTISFLLRFAHLTGNEHAKNQALLSLDKMIYGGIYDQFGGGFARYSTDREWLAPHFEKMLYDNALLMMVLSEALQLTGNKIYRDAIAQTIEFLQREMLHPDGGFYSALDADSEGVEGKFYVWEYDEVIQLLGDDADIFTAFFDIKPGGNWEEKSIPRILKSAADLAKEKGMTGSELEAVIQRGKSRLMDERSKRIRPGLDDKILLGWNALLSKALCQAYAATGEEEWLELAGKNLRFLLQSFDAGEKGLFHTWKGGVAKIPAFLDDYSYVIAALLEYSKVSFDYQWLEKAKQLSVFVADRFSDEEGIFFYYTPDFQTDILVRKKELYDGATPSGNSFMARNLYEISFLLDEPDWRERSEQMTASMGELAGKYPTSFGAWLSLLMEMTTGTNEVAVVGPDAEISGREMLITYLPQTILMVSESGNDRFPLLRGKKISGKTLFFLCKNYECQAPVSSRSALVSAINSNNLYRMQ